MHSLSVDFINVNENKTPKKNFGALSIFLFVFLCNLTAQMAGQSILLNSSVRFSPRVPIHT